MFFLKKYKLGTKLSIGFGAIIVLLMLSIMFGYLGLNRNSEYFSHYRKIAKNLVIAGRIQENLLDSQIAFKNFVATGDKTSQKEFEKHFDQLEALIYDAKSNIIDAERSRKINLILEHAKDYKEGFKKVADYQDKRNAIVFDILTIKGADIEQNLAALMKLSFSTSDEDVLYSVAETQKHLLIARLNVGKYLENNEDNFINIVNEDFFEMNRWLNRLKEDVNTEKGIELLNLIIQDKDSYVSNFLEVVSMIKSRNEIINTLNDIGKEIANNSEEIMLSVIKEQDTFGPKVKEINENATYQMLGISLMAILLSIAISIVIIRIVVFPVRTVTNTFKNISEGESDFKLRLQVKSTDELGEMANYFNKFMEKLQVIMDKVEEHNWLKNGQSKLNEKIRGEQDIISLASNIITFLAKYLDAQIGVIYLKTDNDYFKMVGSYAYKKRKTCSNEIKIGEGLVGQSALEKQTILMSNIPDDYITINSGVGEAVPKNILVTPCLYNDEIKCIIELGSFKEFTDIEIEFVEEIGEIIAISINSAESRTKMKELLEKSLKQTEELQLQQEELRQTNEELEEQAKALKESESRLQTQQEELRVTNEELEERTRSLEKQKGEIDQKNQILEMAQIEIEEKASDLERANKYKSQFLANMSHELRTPLNSILILSKLLADKDNKNPLSEKELQFAKTIYSSGTDLLNLINDILDLSKVEAGKMELNLENMNIRELIYDIEESFKPLALEKDISMSLDISNELPDYIYTDYQRLKQILKNLISNAFKFTEQGSVTIRINRPDKEETLNSSIDYRKAIKFSIIDTGVGIEEDKQKLIFEAFKQSDGTISRKYGGTGLGLFISQELTRILGGTINMKSELGKGSIFSIILPARSSDRIDNQYNKLCDVARSQVDQVDQEEKEIVLVKEDKKVKDDSKNDVNEKLLLIIEEDLNFTKTLCDLADEKEFKYLLARDGETGIQIANNNKPDAIILNIGLPEMNGWEVIERLENNPTTCNIPVHVISGYESKDIDEIKNGIIGCLTKPISLDKIKDMFQKINGENGETLKKLLIVEDNKDQRFSITELLSNENILTKAVGTGEETYRLLKKEPFDCMILDLGLKDISGFDLLAKLKSENLLNIPVIIYTGRELTREEETELQKYTETIIIKGPQSMERLMAETTLFLHSVDSKITEKDFKTANKSYDKENVLNGKKVLIVDDDMRNVFALTSLLEEKNIKVIVGKNGKEGIQKLKENSDTDLVLMDIMMPEMDGYTAMREIRKEDMFRKLPIIALTAKAMKEDRNKCIGAGASDYLTKPVDTNKLISLLRVWLY